MKARSRSWPGNHASPIAHNDAATPNEIQTCSFQAPVSRRGVTGRVLSIEGLGGRLNTARIVAGSQLRCNQKRHCAVPMACWYQRKIPIKVLEGFVRSQSTVSVAA